MSWFGGLVNDTASTLSGRLDSRRCPGVQGYIKADRPSLRLNSSRNSADAIETVIAI
jgi:hypothetical protein